MSQFQNKYPCEIDEDGKESNEQLSMGLKRHFQIHVCAGRGGILLVGAANTGRDFPRRFFRDRQVHHQSPQICGSGWSTRFDGGSGAQNDPSMIVAICVVGGGGYDEPHEAVSFATLTQRRWKDGGWEITTHKFKGWVADSCGVVNDDGMEAAWKVVTTFQSGGKDHRTGLCSAQNEKFPEYVEKYLGRVTQHIVDSFEQGGDLFRR